MFDEKVILEAAILTANRSLSTSELLAMFDSSIQEQHLLSMLQELEQFWATRGLELKLLQNGWRFQSNPQLAPFLERLNSEKLPKYSRAVIETLAIIAYRQPVTRSDIEQIRGVTVSSQIMKQLEERGWIESLGFREVVGRPALWGTSAKFLEDLGIASLSELPAFTDETQDNALHQAVDWINEFESTLSE